VIRVSREAQEQVASLTTHYDDLERPEAVRNLRAAVARGSVRREVRWGRSLRPRAPIQRSPGKDGFGLKRGHIGSHIQPMPEGLSSEQSFMRRRIFQVEFSNGVCHDRQGNRRVDHRYEAIQAHIWRNWVAHC
jgi:hypothetical protein